jgi:glycosyltransferase involved in cell wall biosynthesis
MDIKSSSGINQFQVKEGDLVAGILFPGYGYERVSYALPVKGVSFKRVYSLPIHRLLKANTFYRNTPIVLPSKVDLIHTWNAIPITTKPFVVTFELEIPRYFGNIAGWQRRLGYYLLRSKRCKGIYALSQTAADLAKKIMLELGEKEIADKIATFQGGVELPENIKSGTKSRVGSFSKEEPVKLIFIGGDAFRKGFVPVYQALSKLVERGVSVELTFIGRFMAGSSVLKECSPDPDEWQQKVDDTPWINQSLALPNQKVMALLAASDILLFPSFEESLGWVIIEAAMLGVPAITTNIFAFPELVKHQETGYVIPIQLGEQQRWQGLWDTGVELQRQVQLANEDIEKGVIDAISQIYDDPFLLSDWAESAKTMHAELYDPYNAGNRLADLYQQAVI